MKKNYIVLDIETTGLSKHTHKITELAAVKLVDGKIVSEFQTLVNPQVKIPRFITKLTGITNEMVKDSPEITEILPDFLKFIGNSTIVAHNATFDYGFIHHNSKLHLDSDLENERLCTRKLASRILYNLPSKKLSSICEHFGIVNEQAHRAMGDVKATTEIFLKFLSKLKDIEITTENDILKFESSPIYKCKKLL